MSQGRAGQLVVRHMASPHVLKDNLTAREGHADKWDVLDANALKRQPPPPPIVADHLGALATTQQQMRERRPKRADASPQQSRVVRYPNGGLSAGGYHSAVVDASGKLFVFGCNAQGQLGLGHTDDVDTPTPLEDAFDGAAIDHVSCGTSHTAAVDCYGRLWMWGYGKAGLGAKPLPKPRGAMARLLKKAGTPPPELMPNSLKPLLVPSLENIRVRYVGCGWSHSALITSSFQLYTWGRGEHGKLGHGDEETVYEPKAVTALAQHEAQQVACGAAHTAIITRIAHLAPGCAADRFTVGDPGSETFLMVRSDANRHIKDGGNRYLLAPNMVTFMASRAHVEAKNAAMASPNAATPHPRTLPRAMSRSETPLSEIPIYQGDMPVAPTLSGLLLRGAREIAPPTKGTCHQRQPASSGDVGLLLDHKAKVPKTTLSRLASEHLAKGETGNSLKAELWNSLLGYHTNDAVSEHVASCAPGAEHGNRPAYQFVVVAGPVSDEQLAAPRTPVPLTAREAVQTWDVRKAASWVGTQEGAPPRTVISAPANEYGAYDPARLLHTVAVGSSIYEPNNLDVPSIKGAASGDSFIRVPIASLPTETLTLPPHDPPLAAKHALFLHRLGARTAHVPFARSDMGRPVSPRSARELAVLQKEIL